MNLVIGGMEVLAQHLRVIPCVGVVMGGYMGRVILPAAHMGRGRMCSLLYKALSGYG